MFHSFFMKSCLKNRIYEMMNDVIEVFIEIERHSNQKFEWNKQTHQLELDRTLSYPYFYPYAYGFIPNTLAPDGDPVDVIILTEKKINNNQFISVAIIGVLCMEDEQGVDDKLLCILVEDMNIIKSIDDIPSQCLYDIQWFFSNYKNNRHGKWTIIHGYKDKEVAITIFNQCKLITK